MQESVVVGGGDTLLVGKKVRKKKRVIKSKMSFNKTYRIDQSIIPVKDLNVKES